MQHRDICQSIVNGECNFFESPKQRREAVRFSSNVTFVPEYVLETYSDLQIAQYYLRALSRV